MRLHLNRCKGDSVGSVFVSVGQESLTGVDVMVYSDFCSIHFEFGGVGFCFVGEEVRALAFAESVGLDMAPILERIETARYQLQENAA
ncbi:MAG: hypothetical protein ACRBBW_21280 [Cellvibrionaceae bacterium]